MFPSDEAFLADAFGDFELDKCAPRAIIEELDEFESESNSSNRNTEAEDLQ